MKNAKSQFKIQNFININKEKKERFILDKEGTHIVFFKNLSGKFIFEISRSGVELQIYGLFVGKGKEQYQVETVQYHKAPGATSDLLIKGVFDDQSKFLYKGLIRIEKQAQKSHAYQKNQNLILSPDVFVESEPFLEILANDVFCTHGSTTGVLNKDELYYLASRGIDEKNAKKLLVEGFIGDITEKVQKYV